MICLRIYLVSFVLESKALPLSEVYTRNSPRMLPRKSLHRLKYLKKLKRGELLSKLGLSDQEHFRRAYLQPAKDFELVVLSMPDKPTAVNSGFIDKH
jgi:hypothetical protein